MFFLRHSLIFIFLFSFLFFSFCKDSAQSNTSGNTFSNSEEKNEIYTFANSAPSKPKPFRVVIDPGHGGKRLNPDSVYGDKWDAISKRYLSPFRSGAFYEETSELEEVYELAVLVQSYLQLLQSREGKAKFYEILKKYTPSAVAPSSLQKPLQVFLSRGDNYYYNYRNKQYDPNAPYRLFDYPNILNNKTEKGTISRINSLRPHLVVSLHLTKGSTPDKNGGLSAVITPSYFTFAQALEYSRASLNERNKIRRNFEKGVWRNWFLTARGRDHFEWFLCDAQLYFSGYWNQKQNSDLELVGDREKFLGYRHNMVTWAYRDNEVWENKAIEHLPHSRYSQDLHNFKAEGKFWQREKSQKEFWRREEGKEGYGGDNLYAGHEILRYVRQSLLVHNKKSFSELPQILYPYLSTWSVPTYVNAISAYLELAYINNENDYQRVIQMKKEMAEGIAVGIYSLFYSLEQNFSNRSQDLPWGERIDFARYKNYFDEVMSE